MMNTSINIFTRTVSLAAVSLASAMLFSGCLKEEAAKEAAQSTVLGENVSTITIKVADNVSAETKSTISHDAEDKTILPVKWAAADVLYVFGAKDGYLGSVAYKSTDSGNDHKSTFEGQVKTWSEAQALHIYYMGTETKTFSSNDEKYTFDISTQLGTLEGIAASGHISHGATASLDPGTREITGITMKNMNAVVEFDLNEWTSGVTISGTYNKAILKLKEGTFGTSTDCIGDITLAASACTAESYVSFIPSGDVLTFKQGSYQTTPKTNALEAGCFYSHLGGAIDVPRLESSASLPGEFTVDASGTKVRFSKGNLYCNTSTSPAEFYFEAKQYDCRHYGGYSNSAIINGTIVTTPENTVGTFYFSKTASVSYAAFYYDTGAASEDILFTNDSEFTPKSDFLVSGETGWRALSHNEWTYLLSTRKVAGGKTSYGAATVENVKGLIILPDDWDESLCSTLCGSTSYTSNIFSSSSSPKWSNLEEAGCVFLPAVGFRNSEGSVGNLNAEGGYESSVASDASNTYYLWFKDGGSTVTPAYNTSRVSADAIRLVSNIE